MGKGTRVVMKQQKVAPNPMAAMMKSMEEENEELPPLPDKTLSYLWPDIEGNVDTRNWVTVWPNYVDKGKSIAKGRRINLEDACESPIVIELSAICQAFKLWHALEPFKGYPREPYVMGRVRVRLYLPNGDPAHPDILDKMVLLKKMGTLIPTLHIRKERKAVEAAAMKGGSSSTVKKKGKKGR